MASNSINRKRILPREKAELKKKRGKYGIKKKRDLVSKKSINVRREGKIFKKTKKIENIRRKWKF